jgi:hypothetical protein
MKLDLRGEALNLQSQVDLNRTVSRIPHLHHQDTIMFTDPMSDMNQRNNPRRPLQIGLKLGSFALTVEHISEYECYRISVYHYYDHPSSLDRPQQDC